MTDPLKLPRQLGNAMKNAVDELGLGLATFAVLPAPEAEGEDFVEATFVVKPEAFLTKEEREARKVDELFESMTTGLDISLDEEEASPDIPDDVKAELLRIKKDPTQWLNDDSQ